MAEFLLVPNKVIPPLDRPLIRSIQPADLAGDALVVGIDLDGSSRAYPLFLLIPHHIVNDSLGERPVAATYCPACRSGYVYDPVVRGKRLTFEPVSVRRRNMVMKDRETGSVWQHETGMCLMGAYQGLQLKVLDGEMCNWKTWVHEHPRTSVCFRPEGYRHPSPLGSVFEKLLDHGPEHIVGPGLKKSDPRLGQHDFIIGVMVSGIAKAYPLTRLVQQGIIMDEIGGIPVVLAYEKQADRVKAFLRKGDGTGNPVKLEDGLVKLPLSGPDRVEPLPFVRQWWLAWSEYHPQTELYG